MISNKGDHQIFIAILCAFVTLSSSVPVANLPSESYRNLSVSVHVLGKVLDSVRTNNYTIVCRLAEESINIVTISLEDHQFPTAPVEMAKQNTKDICQWVRL